MDGTTACYVLQVESKVAQPNVSNRLWCEHSGVIVVLVRKETDRQSQLALSQHYMFVKVQVAIHFGLSSHHQALGLFHLFVVI